MLTVLGYAKLPSWDTEYETVSMRAVVTENGEDKFLQFFDPHLEEWLEWDSYDVELEFLVCELLERIGNTLGGVDE